MKKLDKKIGFGISLAGLSLSSGGVAQANQVQPGLVKVKEVEKEVGRILREQFSSIICFIKLGKAKGGISIDEFEQKVKDAEKIEEIEAIDEVLGHGAFVQKVIGGVRFLFMK